MSYILDALNKAERERRRGRQAGPSPATPAGHDAPPRSPWVWVAVLAVALNAVLALLLVWSSWRDERTVVSTVPPAPVETAPVAQPAAVASVPEPAPAPAPASAPANVAPLPAIRPAPRAAVAPTLPLMTDAELQQEAAAQQAEALGETAEPEPAARPEPEPPASRPVPLESIPLRAELPADLQQALPPLRVDVHVYDEARANRFVMINLRRYREGDDLAPDLHLERITREGMVLVFRGRQFRWLNN